jgi:hypothetical protein
MTDPEINGHGPDRFLATKSKTQESSNIFVKQILKIVL